MDFSREAILERVSFLCAREVTKFGDLTPMEIEALLHDAYVWSGLSVHCLRCGNELREPGGLLFSPPVASLARHGDSLDWKVTKDHLCAVCFRIMRAKIEKGEW